MIEQALISQLCSVSFSYNERRAILSGFSLEVSKGEFLGLKGPSGSGKSTILNLLGLVVRPDSGSVFFDGLPLEQITEQRLLELRREEIAFVFQHFRLVPAMTVLENVALPLMLRGCAWKDARGKASQELAGLGLADFAERNPNELSGGEQQRVAIARALVGKPSLVIADEPTGSLDRESSHIVLELLGELRERGSAVVMASHSEQALASCDRVLDLEREC